MDQAETSAAIPAAPQAWADARAACPEYYASVCPDVERILAGPIAAESLAAYVYGLFGRDGTPVSVGATAAAGAAVLDTLFKHRAAQVAAERKALRALAQITDRAGMAGRDETAPTILRATYAGRRVRVIQALEGAQWAIELDGVPVSVSTQSLSDFRSERIADAAPSSGRVADLDEVPASSPCPDCTAGVVRVPGISGATFDCASCDGTGSVLPPGTRVP